MLLAAAATVAEGSLVAPSRTDAVVLTVAAAELHVAPLNQEVSMVVAPHRADRSMPAPATRGWCELGLARRSTRQTHLLGTGELEPLSSTGRRIWPCRR
jgi:hypothetical protein